MKTSKETVDQNPPPKRIREGWAEASKAIAEAGDDVLVMGEFANIEDLKLEPF